MTFNAPFSTFTITFRRFNGFKVTLGTKLEEIEPILLDKHPLQKHPVYNVFIRIYGLETRVRYDVEQEKFLDDVLMGHNYPNLTPAEHDEVREMIGDVYTDLIRQRHISY